MASTPYIANYTEPDMYQNAYNFLITDSNPVHQQNVEQVAKRLFKAARKYPMVVLAALESCEKAAEEETVFITRNN